jgi:hypothetical protein
MTIGNESCNEVDQEVDRAAVRRMLNLTDVFELIGDRFNESTFLTPITFPRESSAPTI